MGCDEESNVVHFCVVHPPLLVRHLSLSPRFLRIGNMLPLHMVISHIHTHAHSLTMVPLGCLPTLIHRADDVVGLRARHTVTA